jgi:hypothetical protein
MSKDIEIKIDQPVKRKMDSLRLELESAAYQLMDCMDFNSLELDESKLSKALNKKFSGGV